MWIVPLAAAVVAGVFAAILSQTYLAGKRPHTLSWAVALLMFAVASFAVALGMIDVWSPMLFRLYYLFGAILNVPVLALGTLYLLAGRRAGHAAAVLVVIAGIFAAGSVFTSPITEPALGVAGVPDAGEVLGDSGVRAVSRIYSIAGFLVVVGGALWSSWRMARREEAQLRRVAGGNILIAAGTAVAAGASRVIRVAQGDGAAAIFSAGLLAAIVLMFTGFLRARGRRSES